ncbi:hypothetical protein ACFV3R_05765 [Streptomyces sp. NPDC059740]|uniref:hypothetical protein n=1 Tax=Streptomyces sp. NPDC059740 TaxID=3346926 RepID=UPI00365DAAB3
MTLPRTYWCHLDRTGSGLAEVFGGQCCAPQGVTTPYPGQAVTWMRETARDIAFTLDREVFATVWAWLGDHRGMEEAVVALRRGRPYVFRFGGERCRWTLLTRPVSVLPTVAGAGTAVGCGTDAGGSPARASIG